MTHGEQLFSIWGPSSDDLFSVGDSGVIVHYDGSTWTKMESGTSLTLFDVWGRSHDDVYAVGMDFFLAQWTVIHFDGQRWGTVVVDSTLPLNRPSGVWGTGKHNVYIASDFAYHFNGFRWVRMDVPNSHINMGCVTGSGVNDVFFVGSFGLVTHWNGMSWKRYDEFLDPVGGPHLRRAWTDGQEVFIVGTTGSLGIIIHGVKR